MRRTLRLSALCAIPLVAVSCATTPVSLDPSPVASGIRERSGVNPGPLAFSKAWTSPPGTNSEDGWTIEEAVSAALWNNPDFHVALGGLGIARADLVDAGLLKNPILSLLFPLGPKQFEAALNLPIEVLWQRPKRVAEAKANVEIVAEQLVAHGLRLIADVRTAYVDVRAAEAALGVARSQSDAARQIADLTTRRFQSGEISELESRLASTDAIKADSVAIARQTTRDLAMVRLRALLNIDPTAPAVRLTDGNPPPLPSCGVLPDLLKTALAARPEVRAAELQIEAAGARAGLERARILTLTATLDANGAGKEGFEMGPGLAIELPVLSKNQGKRARAAADLEQTSRRYLAVRSAVAANVASALARLETAQQAAKILNDDLRASIATQRRQAQSLFDAGEISLLDLLLTQQRLGDIELAVVDASLATWRATIALEDAIGRTCGPQ